MLHQPVPMAKSANSADDGTSDKHSGADNRSTKEVRFRDIASAIEFACWTVVALAPLLRWVNGAAVTNDQFVIQIGLTSVALVGAISLRCSNILATRRGVRHSQAQSHSE
jgi:hypothetical protein